jgi:hypothetical protein
MSTSVNLLHITFYALWSGDSQFAFSFLAPIQSQGEPGTDALLAICIVLFSRPMQLPVNDNIQRAAVSRQHTARISSLTPP